MPTVPDRWALLHIRFDEPFIVIRLTDSDGERTRVHWEGPFWPPHILAVVAERLQMLTSTLPLARPGPHNTGPVPLALFVDVPSFLWSDPLRIDDFVQPLSASIDIDRVQVVGFAGSLRRRRPTFVLPFDIVVHGASAHAAAQQVRDSRWTQDPVVRERGFAILDVDHVDATGLERALRERERDVLITSHMPQAMAAARALPLHKRPRLIVSLEPSPIVLPPAGTALACVGPTSDAVKTILYGLVHDLPVHEAVKAAIRTHPAIAPWASVFADPWTNQSLRMRDALITLQAEAERLETSLPQVGITRFLDRAYSQTTGAGRARISALRQRLKQPEDVFGRAEAAFTELRQVRDQASRLRSLPESFENFEQEGEGLVPMAHESNDLRDLTWKASTHAAAFVGAALDADFRAVLREHQERVVDIALQRLDTSPLLSSLTRRTTLKADAVYHLRVHIGNPLPDSLVVGRQSPIDPLLPEPDDAGHMLEVVVQGKAFDILGERMQPLHLPRFGGTAPVHFDVRTPRELGPASLRVHIYYQNHLVHSYLLEADVTLEEEANSAIDVLRVSLVYAPVERLANLETTQSRSLSIGANGGASGTHELIVKGSNAAGELTLFPSTFEPEVDKFRQELEKASRDPHKPKKGRVYPPVPPGSPAPADAAAVLRSFARQGSDLYTSVKKRAITSNANLGQALQQLKVSRDQKIQIVRFDVNFAFPWMLLYDFILPETPEPLVCLGSVVDAAGNVQPCGHTFDSPVYCVNGFWGVRHYMEELIRRENEIKGPVARPPKDAVRLVCDSTLTSSFNLQIALGKSIGAPHFSVGPAAEATLLDLLWIDPPERPAILIVLGHMDAQAIPGVLNSPGIVLQPSAEWLTQKHFDERLVGSWQQQPRPIVMLMACEAAATTVRTVNDFVTSLNAAGAAAIVGVEAVVASDFAAECARELTDALWSTKTLGQAMTEFRRRTLAAGNPLAFMFHAIGNVDLIVQ